MLLNAFVNHGRWVVQCPECRLGWLVRPEAPHLLIEATQMADAVGIVHEACSCGATLTAQFPSERESIKATLAMRPRASQRNWTPDETWADLRIDNIVHGDGVPD